MSVTIIDKISDPAPIFKYEPPPLFRTTLDSQRYWAKEKERWVEGYEGLPGTFYYACTQGWVKNRITGVTSRYEPRESGLLIHEFIKDQRSKHRMGGIIKPRGVGLSTEFGVLGAYFMRTYPGSTSIFTSRDQGGIQTLFKEKFLPVYNNMPPEIRPDIINKNDTKQTCYLRVGIPIRNPDGNGTDIAESEVYLRETSESPSSPNNLSGKGALFGAYDEFPLHPRRRELLRSSIECYKDPVTKELTGFLLWGGTVEASLTSEQTNQFRSLVNDASLWDCDVLFIPFWMQMFLVNGRPDKKRAEDWWNREYDKLIRASDSGDDLRAFIRNNPRSLQDIFESGEGSRWEDDVASIIRQQRKDVLKDKPLYKKAIVVDYSGKAEIIDNNKGAITYLEGPKPGVDYYTVVDGVATGTDTGAENGSKVAALVIKGFDPSGLSYQPVAMYYERPKSVESSYINITNLSTAYNRFDGFKGIMAEANASTADHFATFLKKKGLGKYIMYRRDLFGNNKVNSTKPFHYVTTDVRNYQMRQANPFMRKYGSSITLLPLLDQMLMAADINTDILDAWLMLFLALPDGYDEPVKEKVKRTRQVRVFKKDGSGRTVSTWITV